MIHEELKFRAEIFKIAGFALMTPLGKVYLDFIPMLKTWGFLPFIIYVMISAALAITGIIIILRAWDLLEMSKNKLMISL